MLEISPNIWGNEFEKDGAAWMEAKWIFPMLSLRTKIAFSQLHMPSSINLRVVKAECRLGLAIGNLAGYFDHIFVERSPDKVKVTEDKCLLQVEANGNNILRILSCECPRLLGLQFVLE